MKLGHEFPLFNKIAEVKMDYFNIFQNSENV